MKKLFVILFFLSTDFIEAQDTLHGPHKGVIAVAGDYRIEAMGCNEYLEVYLYDKFMEPMLNYGMSGDVKYYKQTDVGTSEKLVYYANDGFTAKFPEYNFSYFKVTIFIKGAPFSAKFKNECLIPN